MRNITLRPACPEDEAFLLSVYASTRADELAPLAWPTAQKAAFLAQQGAAQHQHYRTYYKEAQYHVILLDGTAVGRLYVARWASEIRIMDIALLPNYRNAGIGSRLITDLIEEGRLARKTVSVHVESFNPARQLYDRLGFREMEDKGVYRLLRWEPEARYA